MGKIFGKRRTFKKFPEKIQMKYPVSAIFVPHDRLSRCTEILTTVFHSIEIPRHIILMGQNHSMIGERYAIRNNGQWQTPTGTIRIDQKLAALIMEHSPILRADESAFTNDPTFNVQFPYLPSKDVDIIPILISSEARLERCQEISHGLTTTLKTFLEPVLFIVSANLSHFENPKTAIQKDNLMIEKIKILDEKGLYPIIQNENIATCATLPLMILLPMLKSLGFTHAEMIKQTTSCDKTNDLRSVTGYAGFIFYQ